MFCECVLCVWGGGFANFFDGVRFYLLLAEYGK